MNIKKLLLSVALLALMPVLVYGETIAVGDFNYELKSNGSAKVTGMTQTAITRCNRNFLLNGQAYDLVLPSFIMVDGVSRAVDEIGTSAFSGLLFIETVTLPGSITHVGFSAFKNCPSLTTVETSAELIDSDAFYGCSQLSSLTLDEGVGYIEEGSFENCTSLPHVMLPASIGNFNVTSAFAGCSGLKRMFVSAENPVYTAVDGILYTKDKTTLVYCPPSHTTFIYTIPDETQYIGRLAFRDNQYTGTIYLTQAMFGIGPYAFQNAAMKEVVLGPQMISLAEYCFMDCPNLQSIIVLGEAEVLQAASTSFNGLNGTRMYVPDGMETYYQAASPWNNFEIVPFVNGDDSDGYVSFRYVDETSDGIREALVLGLSDFAINNVLGAGYVFSYFEIPLAVYHNEKMYDVTELDNNAFKLQNGIKMLIIKDNIKRVGNGALMGCADLQELQVAAQVLAPNCIVGNPNLTTLTLNEGVTNVMDGALMNNKRLKTVNLPASLNVLPANVFLQDSLKTITVSSGNTKFASIDGVLFNYDKTKLLRWPASNTQFGGQLPITVTELGDYACYKFKRDNVILSNDVTSIGDNCFNGALIKAITLGSGLQSLGANALSGCSNLASIVCTAVDPPATNGSFTGLNQSAITLSVPTLAVPAYKAANEWKEFIVNVYGDVDGDGHVSSVDVTAIYNYMLNGDSSALVNGADLDGDGHISSVDITVLYNIMLGN